MTVLTVCMIPENFIPPPLFSIFITICLLSYKDELERSGDGEDLCVYFQ